jgi:single-stranded DNA-binding protein
MTIDVAFFGFLAGDADCRTSKAGKPWTKLRVGVGRDDETQWVNVAVFGKAAETAATFKKGDRVYCEGVIKLDAWCGNDGIERHGLSCAAFKCEPTHRIGRNRARKDRPDAKGSGGITAGNNFYSDPIPFAPEWR